MANGLNRDLKKRFLKNKGLQPPAKNNVQESENVSDQNKLQPADFVHEA